MKPTAVLRTLLREPGIIPAPGVYDALSARLVEQAGFKVAYMTGSGVSTGMLGYPDIGLTSFGEMLDAARRICNAISIPVIADADTGYGNVNNVYRAIREYERVGLAGCHIEDQVFPKKCGHFEGKGVVSKEEMAEKIRAAVAAREDPDFVIIARTDARAVAGLEDAIERSRAYAKAGADMIFLEAPQSVEELERVARIIDKPLVANMVEGGKTPLYSHKELERMGYKLVIHANTLSRCAMKAMQDALIELKENGTAAGLLDRMASFQGRNLITKLAFFEEWEKRFGA